MCIRDRYGKSNENGLTTPEEVEDKEEEKLLTDPDEEINKAIIQELTSDAMMLKIITENNDTSGKRKTIIAPGLHKTSSVMAEEFNSANYLYSNKKTPLDTDHDVPDHIKKRNMESQVLRKVREAFVQRKQIAREVAEIVQPKFERKYILETKPQIDESNLNDILFERDKMLKHYYRTPKSNVSTTYSNTGGKSMHNRTASVTFHSRSSKKSSFMY
eukprot:TRINITY_DN8361_c0_g2_i1.p1 TRINITY_DN8361_c0_g2~~TRINITY_DN8361_c0_g2_i1.p1  ORF type:complete len:216 (+),score=33.01 TRINITY_DN8361_c0_g2_i1:64-711(+)